MAKLRVQSERIRTFILAHVDEHSTDIAKVATQHFSLSRQAINKHLQKLVEEKSLAKVGHTQNTIYKLSAILEWEKSYQLQAGLAEDLIWRTDIRPLLGHMPDNVLEIWHYSFTEMFNNVIDHSGGKHARIEVKKTATTTEMFIHDDGIGIFKKIQTALHLIDERHAIFELSKGKLTTAPKHHSGEGIFFTSRMFDHYAIISGGIHFSHDFKHPEDWIAEINQFAHGTTIWMKLPNHIARTTKKIFDQFTSGENYGFNKTVVPVKLAQYGDDLLISRSQAKRLVARIELFKTVIFDFKAVSSIGQAFADEIFRVFARQNPKIELLVIHANTEVKQMIERAKTRL